MSSPRPARLYSPQVLALAIELAAYPLGDELPLRAEARSRTCGSTITVGLSLDANGAIGRVGMQVSACAIGQGSAALLARSAKGCDAGSIAATLTGLEQWLAGTGELPAWPDLELLAPARAHPARHAALLLPWKAASKALSSRDAAG
ncbi:iron-sulfur cluster assembly scaffold protein [Erythrobacter sp.]|uniref:iron-sulfur cluster assembly scaffold protein n=1 Tax=Erythrobacter sp. TaxID=1042 RepID=UPI0025ECF5C0|nr:iron-sulfur cluster assembly scaffold protein [Erythrobacter sp.]